MYKILNFSTVLFSYILITVLVISCGGSGGGGGGSGGSGGSNSDGSGGDGGGDLPQADLDDKNCLLSDRRDQDAVAAVLCQGDIFIGLITKTTPAGQEAQQLGLLIPSTDNAGSTGRTWDLSKGAQIEISSDKDYTLTVDKPADGFIEMITATTEPDATDSSAAAYLLQRLTINSNVFINDTKDALRSIGITFSPAAGSAIKVAIAPKLAVKTQADFISIAKFSIPELTAVADYQVPFVLADDLALVAPDGEAAKFEDAVIPVAEKAFDFDGGGHTISLNSAIDAVANNKPAAIIGELQKNVIFRNFTLDINKPISGSLAVSTLLARSTYNSVKLKAQNINININSNLTVYKHPGNTVAYAGGLAGTGCLDINNVVVKTADTVAIRAAIKDDTTVFEGNIGGLVSIYLCFTDVSINNNVVDVTLGGYAADNTALNNISEEIQVRMGGIVHSMNRSLSVIRDNLVNLKFYRNDKLPIDFAFDELAGLSSQSSNLKLAANNLVYVDFSNLGKVRLVGGLFVKLSGDDSGGSKIANNMLFIADGFDDSSVISTFGAAIESLLTSRSALNITDNFFSSPFSDSDYTNNTNIASFVYSSNKDINFNNLILDNKSNTIMFKAGDQAANLQGKVANATLSTLTEGADSPVAANLKASDSWEAGSQDYPQLKVPADFSEAKKADWDRINGLIQTGLAARANQ